jgi:hypothetical protein
MSKIHKKTGSLCVICDEPITPLEEHIIFHKSRRQTHSLCMDCGVGYLQPILKVILNNIKMNIRKNVDVIKCPGSYKGLARNRCNCVKLLKEITIPECILSLDIFRITFVITNDYAYLCPEEKCGTVIEVDSEYFDNNLQCHGGCNTTWCRNCLVTPFHYGKSCIEVEAENKNSENGKFIWDMKNKGHLKFCPQCRAPSIKNNGCFSADTLILMWGGNIKQAKDIVIGDILIGDDGNKRIVQELVSGFNQMYKVTQDKADDYIVNGNHTLVLKALTHKSIYITGDNKYKVKWFDHINKLFRYKKFNIESHANTFCDSIIDNDIVHITVEEHLKLSKNIKKFLVGFRSNGVNWESKDVKINPYIFGIWLVSNNSYLYNNITSKKYIPAVYLTNDRHKRLSLLAGIIDADGYLSNYGTLVTILHNNLTLVKQILILSMSLGFITSYSDRSGKGYVINISGEKLSDIPTLISIKKCIDSKQTKDYLTTSISITNIGHYQYYGWKLNKNSKFVLADFTVTHNCNKMVCANCSIVWCWLCTNCNIGYDHYNTNLHGSCTGKLWEGVDSDGNAIVLQ